MSDQRTPRVEALFLEASELAPDEREDLLSRVAQDDPAVAAEVSSLLAFDRPDDDFLRSPIIRPDVADGSAEPTRIGRYRVLRTIAAGGMGTVYEAEQDHPQRTVALKLMKRGVTSRSALRRFEHESQLLARLHHPGIAQVYDVGMYDDGSGAEPYFVMELIPEARTLTDYAHSEGLGTRERLELLINVCDAVHHGHQKSIIHRDLKPGNILVDDCGSTKIIDFGVARATDMDIAITTMGTDIGQLVGTLAYMSPEQCAADPDDLDTRSDVYSLGVVMYELLCGHLPHDLSHVPFPEAARVIREEAPAKPSTVNRSLRGDVETIVLKALEKERDRRYQSAADLAQDISRYLNHEPIAARRASVTYQLGKFARRNKGLVGAAALVFVVLVAGVVVSSGFAVGQARAVRDAEAAKVESEQQKDIAESVVDFLTNDLLAAVEPSAEAGRGKDVLMRDVLDEAARRIEQDDRFAGGRLAEATVRAALGNTYYRLGQPDLAEPHLTESLRLRQAELGAEHADTLTAATDLVTVYVALDRMQEAETLCVRTLDQRRRVLGNEHPDTLQSMHVLGTVYQSYGRFIDAEGTFARTLNLRHRVLGSEHPDTLTTMDALAAVYGRQDRWVEAEELFAKTLMIRRQLLGEEHPDTIMSLDNLGWSYRWQGRYDEAIPLYLRAVEIERRVLGDDHPNTLSTRINLAVVYKRDGQYDESESWFREGLESSRRVFGEDHRMALLWMSHYGDLYTQMGRYDEALPLLSEAVAEARHALPDGHWRTAEMLLHLGLCLTGLERYDEAKAALLEAHRSFEAALGAAHQRTRMAVAALIDLHDAWGKPDKAAEWRAKLPTEEDAVASNPPADEKQEE